MADWPTNDVLFTDALVEKLSADAKAKPELEHAFDTKLRHSNAGKCGRFIGMKVAGYGREDMDEASLWVIKLGRWVHEQVQAAILERFPQAQIEAKVRFDDLDSSGHLDALVEIDGRRICYELKSMGVTPFDMAIGFDRNARPAKWRDRGAEGPKTSAKIQGALNGLAADSDELRIGIVGLEALSKNMAERFNLKPAVRFTAEWVYPRSVFEPWAIREKGRLAHLLKMVEKGQLPHRWAVDDNFKPVELNPDAQRPHWMCTYCDMRDLCSKAGPGEPNLPIPGVPLPTPRVIA